jgi:hypothetical protein
MTIETADPGAVQIVIPKQDVYYTHLKLLCALSQIVLKKKCTQDMDDIVK